MSRRAVLIALSGLVVMSTMLGVPQAGAAPRAVRSSPGSQPAPSNVVKWTLTTGDRAQLLANQLPASFGAALSTDYAWSYIEVNDAVRFQTVQGVGAALTESSATLLKSLPTAQRTQVLNSLFSPVVGAGLSVLRTPLGASDFALSDYTFDDLAAGASDPALSHFSTSRDQQALLPLVAAAHAVNPDLTVLATPWSAPAWMKTNLNTHDGALAPAYETAYAKYLVKALLDYRAHGAPVSLVTVVNEPESPKGYSPSMTMSESQQADFVAGYLRPALNAAGLAGVGILGYDGNWDDATYPTDELTGPDAASFAGAAFHCYAGDETAQSRVASAAPNKQIWMSECSGGEWSPDFAQNLRWDAHHLLIGAFRNSARGVVLFNLALNPEGGPTNGGCQDCRGVLTIDPRTHTVSENVEYYLLAQVGRFVRPGAVRIDSTYENSTGVQSVAFLNPNGSHVLVVYNEGGSVQPVTVLWRGRVARVHLPAGSVATLTW